MPHAPTPTEIRSRHAPELLGPVDPLLYVSEVALHLKKGISTVHRAVAQGLLPRPIKLGGASRWPRSEILAVIEAAKTQRDRTSA